MRIGEALVSWRTWFVGLWPVKRVNDSAKHVLDLLEPHLGPALDVVTAIDEKLKPAIRTASVPLPDTIVTFLRGQLEDAYGREITDPAMSTAMCRLAERVQYLPMSDLLVNVALFLLQQAAPNNAGVSLLRLAIEFAYNVFKGAGDEAEVS